MDIDFITLSYDGLEKKLDDLLEEKKEKEKMNNRRTKEKNKFENIFHFQFSMK